MKRTNDKVSTPLGSGIVQGGFMLKQLDDAIRAVLVRVPLTDETRKRLKDANCMTPRANGSALFIFREGELS